MHIVGWAGVHIGWVQFDSQTDQAKALDHQKKEEGHILEEVVDMVEVVHIDLLMGENKYFQYHNFVDW